MYLLFVKYSKETRKVIGVYDELPSVNDGEAVTKGFINRDKLVDHDYFVDAIGGNIYGYKKPQLSETEILGQQLVEKDLQVLELQRDNQALGQQIVGIDLRLLMGGI